MGFYADFDKKGMCFYETIPTPYGNVQITITQKNLVIVDSTIIDKDRNLVSFCGLNLSGKKYAAFLKLKLKQGAKLEAVLEDEHLIALYEKHFTKGSAPPICCYSVPVRADERLTVIQPVVDFVSEWFADKETFMRVLWN